MCPTKKKYKKGFVQSKKRDAEEAGRGTDAGETVAWDGGDSIKLDAV
jgi:hypothetical protein